MTDRILSEIAETEARALELEHQAATQGRDTVQSARTAARQMQETGTAEDEETLLAAVAKTDVIENEKTKDRLSASAIEAEGIRKNASANMDAAVAAIVKGVIDEYGHS